MYALFNGKSRLPYMVCQEFQPALSFLWGNCDANGPAIGPWKPRMTRQEAVEFLEKKGFVEIVIDCVNSTYAVWTLKVVTPAQVVGTLMEHYE